ncbi:hypothetical protein ACWGOK_32450 [Streptomyces eurythermus]
MNEDLYSARRGVVEDAVGGAEQPYRLEPGQPAGGGELGQGGQVARVPGERAVFDADAVADVLEVVGEDLLRVRRGGVDQGEQADLSGGAVVEHQLADERAVGVVGSAVGDVPLGVVARQLAELLPAQLAPRPADRADQELRGRLGQQCAGVAARGVRGAEPVAGGDAEVAAPAAGVGPPQVAAGVVRLAGGDHRAGPAPGVDHDHLHGVEVVDDQAVQPAHRSPGAAADVAVHGDRVAEPGGDDDAPLGV